MELKTALRAQAFNNALANHRLLKACSRLSQADLDATRVSFFPSIMRTLNHILTVDWFYVSALEGACIGYAAFEPEIPCPLFADLDSAQRAVDRRLISVCTDTDPAAFDQAVALVRPRWTQHEPRHRTLLHLFEHQIHHRGQVHAMLSGTSVSPPQLDEFFMSSAREQALRAEDFRALGFSEDMIWPED
jgi:uncharacterized damage-inducible protein DinB